MAQTKIQTKKRHPKRFDQKWMDIIQECRSSGMSDKVWCTVMIEAVPKARQKKLKLLDIHSEQEIPELKEKTASDDTLLPAEKGVVFCNHLFFLERLYKDLPAEERKQKRQEKEPAIWDVFWNWLDTLNPTGGSKLEKAVNYARNHRETLINYLLDGRCEISNNSAERRAKEQLMPWGDFIKERCSEITDTEKETPENRVNLLI